LWQGDKSTMLRQPGAEKPGNPRPSWFSSQCPGIKSGARGIVVGSLVLLDNGSSTVENQSELRRMDLQFAGREDWQDTENNNRVLGAQSG
jgi:hypothetical protein